jgi:hypothetical protein
MDAKNSKDNRKDDKSTINSSSPKDSKPVASKSTEKSGTSSMKDSKNNSTKK